MENVNWDQLFYYEDLLAYAKYLQAHYPSQICLEVIGRSLDGRDIFMIKVGRGAQNIIITGGVHGRESVNPMVLLSMAEYYCEELSYYLEQVSIYIVPLLNPDGYMVSLCGFDSLKHCSYREAMKSKGIPFYLWKYNARGIDINRNFPCLTWKQKFLRDTPASEPETMALIYLFQQVPSIGYIDYHCRGKQIYYYRNSMSKEYNERQYRLACILSTITDYILMSPQSEIEAEDSGGNTVHFYSEEYKQPAFTIETVDELAVFPLSPHYQKDTFEEIKLTPFVFCKK